MNYDFHRVTADLPAHGTGRASIPPFSSLAPSPEWSDLVRVRAVGQEGDWISIERLIPILR